MSTIQVALQAGQTICASSTIAEAAHRMWHHSARALAVTDGTGGSVLGIVTERDVVAVVAAGLDPREITLAGLVASAHVARIPGLPGEVWLG
jgi:CBS domain-containing protein